MAFDLARELVVIIGRGKRLKVMALNHHNLLA
jgi:hypothetical protein